MPVAAAVHMMALKATHNLLPTVTPSSRVFTGKDTMCSIMSLVKGNLLLVSSATFHRAGQAIRQDDHGRCRRWLLITAGLGLAFLVSQMVEYFTLPFGLTDNLYASTFFAATGFHGLHVTLGALMTLIVWWQARQPQGRVTAADHFPLEAAELYWHFVDGIWVILFVILYLL